MPKYANNGSLLLMAVVKALIALLVAVTACYCIVAGVDIPDNALKIVLLVLGGYFAYSAKVYYESERMKTSYVQQTINLLQELDRQTNLRKGELDTRIAEELKEEFGHARK
jgi:hypothetical protein